MMKTRSKKITRLVAVVLTLAMLLSAMMVQAFAAVIVEPTITPNSSGTLQGYNVSATVAKTSALNTFTCYALSDVNMAVRVDSGSVSYKNLSGGAGQTINVSRGTDYYGYDLSFPFNTDRRPSGTDSFAVSIISVKVAFTYNGEIVYIPTTRGYT